MQVTATIPSPASPLNAQVVVVWDAAREAVNQPYRVDWGDGTIQSVAGGTNTVTHTYAKEGFYKIKVAANEATTAQSLRVGTPDFRAPGAAAARAHEVVREDAAAILGTKAKLG